MSELLMKGHSCTLIAAAACFCIPLAAAAPCSAVLSLQHVYTFTQHLKHGKLRSKRQLDCGGVVTTVLAACHSLAQTFGHADLAQCRFQVCFMSCCSLIQLLYSVVLYILMYRQPVMYSSAALKAVSQQST